MPIDSNYLFVVNMDVDAPKEALFNEIYDTEHIPNLLKVPGVRATVRDCSAASPSSESRRCPCCRAGHLEYVRKLYPKQVRGP